MRNSAPPISSARTPPGPNATSGPKTGSCTMPARSSVPPRTIGCTISGPPIRSAAARISSSVSRFSATPPLSVLCTPAAAVLSDDGTPELRPRPRCRRRRRRRRCSGTSGTPYAERSVRASRRVEPDVVGRGERRLDDAAVLLRGRRRRASGPCRPAAAAIRPVPRRARAPGGGFRIRRTSRPASRSAQERCRRAVGAHDDSEHRLLRSSRLERRADRRRDLVGAGDDRRHEEHDHGVDSRVAQQQRQRLRVGRRRSRSRAGRRDSRRSPRSAGRLRAPAASRRRAPAARAPPRRRRRRRGCRARRRSSARRRGGRPAAAGSTAASRRRRAPRGCARETRRRCRKSASTAASEPASAAVCELAARAPAPEVPALSATIGLLRATRPATRANFCGLPNDSR